MRINHKTKTIKKDFKENTFVAFISEVCKGIDGISCRFCVLWPSTKI